MKQEGEGEDGGGGGTSAEAVQVEKVVVRFSGTTYQGSYWL